MKLYYILSYGSDVTREETLVWGTETFREFTDCRQESGWMIREGRYGAREAYRPMREDGTFWNAAEVAKALAAARREHAREYREWLRQSPC